MNINELKKEAEMLGYTIIKKQPYVKHGQCRCGSRGEIWHHAPKKMVFIKCSNGCGQKTGLHKTEREAWIEWNAMNERED